MKDAYSTDEAVVLSRQRAELWDHYRHPWLFSKGIISKPKQPPGSLVPVFAEKGQHLGWAFYHPKNAIALRMVSTQVERPDARFWRRKIARALEMRKMLLPAGTRSYRLIHGENDGFPGLTVDVFGDWICMQVTTLGMDLIKVDMAHWVSEVTGIRVVYERSEGHARRQEGLDTASGFLMGECEFPHLIDDRGFSYSIDPRHDQKTGFYLDQRRQRLWLETHAFEKRVLDLCCYTGGFTMAALRGGASEVWSVDSSARALEALEENLQRNQLDKSKHSAIQADVFDYLHSAPEQPFDILVLDPPPLAKSTKAEESALKGYRQLQRMAAPWLKRGGILMTFSCSGVVSRDKFRQSVFLGMRDAGREPLLVEEFGAGPDHPVSLNFPEGEYLKGLAICVQ